MKVLATLVVTLMLASCGHPKVHGKPKLTDAQIQRIRETDPNMTDACLRKAKYGGIESLGDFDACHRMTARRRWSGLWRNNFEDSRFCSAPAVECSDKTPGVYVSLEFKTAPAAYLSTPPGGLYAVEFIGRRTLVPDRIRGVPSEWMMVDKFISIKAVEPPPPQPTKAEIVKYWKKCEAAKTCKPNWDMINKL